MNTPLERALQILEDDNSVLWDADLKEHAPEGDDKDQDAVKYADAVPTFHGLSANGDVTGHLVDGNYCSKDDYDKLVADGAPLKGSIVLCRYGGIVRGLKIKGGQENGAIGTLIYSDPRDDGTVTVDEGFAPYPDGPARNPTSVQRGSVQFLSIYPGDPTTPGYPSYENTTRTEGTNIPSIPSLPVSWENAKQLLQVLQDGSPLQGKRVRLFNSVDTRVIPIWNVVGVIPGYIKNEVVVAGNHRDAWVLGAVDPSSGTVSIHEVIRGFGHLMKKGWKPLRTIVIASWDAEEYGLIGSTEWGEDFADWIDQHVVAYFNLDSSVGGSKFGTSGSPLLAHFIRDTAQDIPHPTDANRTLWDARNDEAADNLGVSPLGSGSDYTVFLQRSGVPSTNEGFSPASHDPVYHYHSVYDSETWQEKYGDPGFSRHIAVAQHLGIQIMRMANAPVLPFNTTYYTVQLEGYLDTEFSNMPPFHAPDSNTADGEVHRPTTPDFERHKRWRKALFRAIHRVRVVNDKLRSFEPGFISEGGIKDREWFKHLGVAPGKWLGYGATTLPGLTEAIVFDQDKDAANHEAQRLVDLLDNMAAKLKA
ncbi:Glutamate carboxypeptidase 2 [Leucoagaricus sp. SymC.cos]|nr:Glutamate carboxypeptidase 2 [Leucoagaricus sp. SymC.cos]